MAGFPLCARETPASSNLGHVQGRLPGRGGNRSPFLLPRPRQSAPFVATLAETIEETAFAATRCNRNKCRRRRRRAGFSGPENCSRGESLPRRLFDPGPSVRPFVHPSGSSCLDLSYFAYDGRGLSFSVTYAEVNIVLFVRADVWDCPQLLLNRAHPREVVAICC